MMKKLIWFSTLSLAMATMSLPAVAQGQETQPNTIDRGTPGMNQPGQPNTIDGGTPGMNQPGQPNTIDGGTPGIIQPGRSDRFDSSAPRISSTTGLRDRHYISLYTGEQPLSHITIRPQRYMSIGENIQVMDQTGQRIDANVTREGDRYRVDFAQPIAADTKVEIGVRNFASDPMPAGRVFLYEVSGGHVGFQRDIPYGLARVQVF
jgi:hypothetical protein